MAGRDDPGKTQPEESATDGSSSRPGSDPSSPTTEPGGDPFATRVTEGSIEAIPMSTDPDATRFDAAGVSPGLPAPWRRLQPNSGDAPGSPMVMPRVPGYELLGIVGRGGMGVVYKARRALLNRVCALKMIRAGDQAGSEEMLRFVAEAEAVARLEHPNIVQVHHFGEADGLPYVELEYLEGGSLDKALDGEPMEATATARLVETLARAVHFAHQAGVVHRDLKPANILLAADGTPKIGDFGLAKSLVSDSGLTRSGVVVGTPSYMAPEQAGSNGATIGPAVDIYALGAILYELLTGAPPFRGADIMQTLEQVRTAEPVPPSRLVPGVPRDLETIVLTCLHKEPSRRYPSAEALAEELGRFLEGRPILARPVGAAERAWRWCGRNPWLAAVGAAAALLLGAVVVGSTAAAVQFRRMAEMQTRLANEARVAELRAVEARRQAVASEREAREQARRASDQAERARATSRFLAGLFEAADPVGFGSRGALLGANPGAGDVTAREMLDRGLAQLDDELLDRPETRGDLLHAIGMAYLGVGQLDGAERALRRALEVRRKALGPNHPDVADTLQGLGLVLLLYTDVEAEPVLREALAIRRAQFGPRDRRTAETMYFLGLLLLIEHLGEPGEPDRLLDEATALVRDLEGPESREYGLSLLIRAVFSVRGGDVAAGLSAFATARGILNRSGPDPLIRLCDAALQATAAETMLESSPVGGPFLERLRKLNAEKAAHAAKLSAEILGPDHALTGYITKVYADALARINRPEEAKAAYHRTLEICRRVYGDNHRFTAATLLDLGRLVRSWDLHQAEQLVEQALAIMRHGRGKNIRLTHTLYVLGHIKYALGREDPSRIETGLAMLREAVESALNQQDPDPAYAVTILRSLVEIYRKLGGLDAHASEVAEFRRAIATHPDFDAAARRDLDDLTAHYGLGPDHAPAPDVHAP